MSAVPSYPVRVEGRLDPGLSRWLWLVKWLLAIPHYVVLVFLWAAFFVLSLVALVAIVLTGRYPRRVFDFNVGVLRWTWRVGFYSLSALATDRYPPFTLGPAADYPATLDVEYPERLSRGLALVKWWLLAIPHYLIVGGFVGGGAWFAWQTDDAGRTAGVSLLGILVMVAAVGLLFTGRYPSGVFDLVLGLDRWALRVAAYAGLMTDRYPPFRLDMGGAESGSMKLPTTDSPSPGALAIGPQAWSGGRVALVITGCVTALIALALVGLGAGAVVVDQTQRENGFVTSPAETYSTATHALVSETVFDGPEWAWRDLVGTVRIRSTSDETVFVGIGREADVRAYLGGVSHERVNALGDDPGEYDRRSGNAPTTRPDTQNFWAASLVGGSGTHMLEWDIEDGHWWVVLMNSDASPGVAASLDVGAELDPLLPIGIGLLAAAGLLAMLAAVLITLGVPRSRDRSS